MAGKKVQAQLSEDELDEEDQPLVPLSTMCRLRAKIACCRHLHFRYRLLLISQKGAIFVILLNAFIILSASACVLNFQIEPLSFRLVLFSILSGFVLLLSPVIALLSECYFGRYRIVQTAVYVLLVAIVLMGLTIVAMPTSIWYVVCVVFMFSIACYASCIIPFAMDQMVGASGEELSFTFYWIFWPFVVCAWTVRSLDCHKYASEWIDFLHIVLFAIAALSFAFAFAFIQCCNNVLITKHQLSNPIKMVAHVLNYAIKHQHPDRRSAFTYWEEECPSRIDLGKNKYGGPFTFEEVEDVKTVVRLIPLLSCIMPVIALGFVNTIDPLTAFCHLSSLSFWINLVFFIVVATTLPIYQFVIYPFLYNYIPSMLRRIGYGMLLIILSQALISAVGVYLEGQAHFTGSSTTCPVLEKEQQLPALKWLLMSSYFITRVGVLVATCSAVEFAIAQAPYQLRGFVTSICLGLWGIFTVLGLSSNWFVHDCKVNIALSALSLCVFLLYLFVSKRYKLRERNEVIPYHTFAEKQFESNYRIERQFLKDRS